MDEVMIPTDVAGRLTVGGASGETDVLLLRRRLPWDDEYSINLDMRNRFVESRGVRIRVVV